jgi:hypothetical protein
VELDGLVAVRGETIGIVGVGSLERRADQIRRLAQAAL